MRVCVCVTDSPYTYPAVWINAPTNERTMANYNLENAKENIFSWRECGKKKKSTIADMRAENRTVDYRTMM